MLRDATKPRPRRQDSCLFALAGGVGRKLEGALSQNSEVLGFNQLGLRVVGPWAGPILSLVLSLSLLPWSGRKEF